MKVKDLQRMLQEFEASWTIEDNECLGKFEEQDICVFNGSGISNKVYAEFDSAYGIVFDSERG